MISFPTGTGFDLGQLYADFAVAGGAFIPILLAFLASALLVAAIKRG
jgi:hypothetical protein